MSSRIDYGSDELDDSFKSSSSSPSLPGCDTELIAMTVREGINAPNNKYFVRKHFSLVCSMQALVFVDEI